MIIDLHTHSDYSDGILSPADTIGFISSRNISFFSLTDHDSILGIPEAQSAVPENCAFLPGAEISCMFNNRMVHLLAYFPYGINSNVKDMLNKILKARLVRAQAILDRLNDFGFQISMDDIEMSRSNATGRANIARALSDKGYFKTPQDSFAEYLGNKGKAFVPIQEIDVSRAISNVNSSKGLCFLAHPDLDINQKESCQLADYSITGLEILHPKITPARALQLTFWAKKFNLAICGGSDYHGDNHRGPYKPASVNPGDYGTDWIFDYLEEKNIL
jgi:predicted metal-dependent phosphoesterase TrpH